MTKGKGFSVAIVGMAFRFPGNVSDDVSMWRMLSQGAHGITRIPDDRWSVEELQHADRAEPGRSVTFSAGVLADIATFDADFFGLSPREAAWLDPQQRLLLEMAYEAMEGAGIRPTSLAGSRCGVYMGISSLDYGLHGLEDLASMSAHSMTGNTLSIAANRLSYFFDLHGPSMAVDTACSSSLVALHHACQALRTGEVPMALVGGVSLLMHPYSFVGFSKASMLSPHGHCRPFDAEADGYVRAEGGAVLLLKPWHKAVEDGDTVHALLVASGVNADGRRKAGLTIPSVAAQAELMREVLDRSGLSPDDVAFIEAHGTGTPVGDPVEAAAIGQVYGVGRACPMPVSSVKANFGHLEPASGMAGLVKAVLALKKGTLPPLPFAYTPNPHIDFNGLNIACAATAVPLHHQGHKPRVAGVNSFGFGGVNAHVLLQVPEPSAVHMSHVAGLPMPPLLISARTEESLKDMAAAYADGLEGLSCEQYYDVAFSAAFHRDRLEKRLAIMEESPAAVATALRSYAGGGSPSHLLVESALSAGGDLAFVYTGNGAQWQGMGRTLCAQSSEFVAILSMLDAHMRPLTGFSVLEAFQGDAAQKLEDTTVSQPLLFAVQVGVTLLLKEWGITPQAVMGHSVGEIAAAWAAGALSLEQAVRVICVRSQAQGKTQGMGRMAAVGLSEEAVQERIQQLHLEGELEIAGVNSPSNVTISGNVNALAILQRQVEAHNVFFRLLDLEYAFHSRKMDDIRNFLLDGLHGLTPSDTTAAIFVSTVTGETLEGSALDGEYWWKNVRQPVRFSQAVETLSTLGCRIFVEVGPHAILQRYIRESAASGNSKGRVLSTLLRGDDGKERIARLAARLHILSEKGHLRALFPQPGRRVALPLYPWQRQRYWRPSTSEAMSEKRRVHPLLGWALDGAGLAWENILHPSVQPWLADHKVGSATVFPGAGYVELALATARAWLGQESVALESLDISIPLVFEDSHAACVRCSLNSADGTVRIISRPRLGTGEWVQHAAGRVVSAAGRTPRACMEPLPQGSRTVDGAQLYALTTALGLDYGPAFRVVEELHISGARLDATLVPMDGAAQGFLLPPAALDACFHSLVCLYAEKTQLSETAFLPVKTGRLDLCGTGTVTQIRAQVQRHGRRSLAADFELLDATGQLVARASDCRFRAVPLMTSAQAGIDAWRIRPWNCPHPLEKALPVITAPEAVTALVAHLTASAARGDAQRQTWYRHALPLMEAMVLSSALRAFHALAADNPQWADHMRDPYARWLLRLLEEEGLLRQEDGTWFLSPPESIPPPEELWLEVLRNAPQCLPALLPVGRVGRRLEDVLRGRVDGVTLWEEVHNAAVYKESRPVDPAYQGIREALNSAVHHVAAAWPATARLRVLEVGAAPGGITETLAAALPDDRFSHVMALSSPEALSQARTRYVKHPSVSITSFDPVQWAQEEGENLLGRFDVVILRHTLHRAASLPTALARVRGLLEEGGLLLLAERHPDWSVDFLEGLHPTWWHASGTGVGASAVSSLLPAKAWQGILAAQQFSQCHVYTEPVAEGLDEGAYLLLSTHAAASDAAVQGPKAGSWLLLSDAASDSLALELGACLTAHGQRVLYSGAAEEPSLQQADHVVFMRGAGDSPSAVTPTLDSLLQCAQVCVARASAPPRLWIVTHGGALGSPVGGACASNPAQGAVWGLGRVIMNEYSELSCVLLDVAASPPSASLSDRLARELLYPDGNDEILLTDTSRHALRLEAEPAICAPQVQERCRLDFTVPGRLINLVWSAETQAPLPPGQVEARVMATGLNFRDVMLVMGLLPDDAVENGFAGPNLGLEFSGIITRVGEGVHDLHPGDRVVGFAPSCFASHVVTPAHTVARMPEEWSHEAAATVPTVFFTAYYALKHLAQMQPGERLLIHGAAGGVGLAAIQVARHMGVEIFATAGSEEKRDLVRLLGVEHVFDSRNLSFAHDVMAATKGQGVDAVLNSLAGEAMRRSIGILRPFGRFLELGKRDFVENTSLGLRPLKENISYFAIDADQLLTARPQLASGLFSEAMQLMRQGVLTPLPHRVFPARQVVDAFRAMQQSRHMGKIVVSLENLPPVPPAVVAAPCPTGKTMQGEGTWIVTGGLSGFGLATARRLARRGVRTLVLVGRRGAQTPGADEILAEFAALGVTARAEACDMADYGAVQVLLDGVRAELPPLRGIVHAAAVFDDRMLARIDAQSLEAVLAPKLSGAWHLHQATLHDNLEQFVLYSSVSAALGNPGQGNYVAANAGLEALARLRASMGLPALCIAWGPVGDVGYLARQGAVKKSLAQRLGREPLTAEQVMDQLDVALDAANAATSGMEYQNHVRVLANVDWSAVRGMFPGGGAARFAHVFRHADPKSGGEAEQDIHQRLAGKSSEQIMEIVRGLIIEEVAQVLALGVGQVSPERTLQSMGMDSLMAVELAVGLEQRIGVRLPAMMLQDSPTVEQIAGRVVARLSGAVQEDDDAALAAELARRHAEELTEDDVDAMARSAAPQITQGDKS